MYICKECSKSFFKPKSFFERHGLKSPPFEQFLCCPYCRGTDFEGSDE